MEQEEVKFDQIYRQLNPSLPDPDGPPQIVLNEDSQILSEGDSMLVENIIEEEDNADPSQDNNS